MTLGYRVRSVAALCCLTLVAQLALPVRRAEAIVGIIVYAAAKNHKVGVPLMIAGGVGILPGAPVVGVIAAAAYTPPASAGIAISSAALVGIGAGIFAALLGLVVLKAPAGGQDIAFSALAPSDVQALGLSDDEARAYQDELPEINAVRETVRDDVLRSGDVTFENAGKTWDFYSKSLSRDAYEGLKKVAAGARRTMGL